MLQKRRRCFPNSLLLDAVSGRYTHVFHGASSRADAHGGRPWSLQDSAALQGHRLRRRRHVLLDECLLHRYSSLGDFLFLYVNAQR